MDIRALFVIFNLSQMKKKPLRKFKRVYIPIEHQLGEVFILNKNIRKVGIKCLSRLGLSVGEGFGDKDK